MQELVAYEQFCERIPGVSYRTLVRESKLGRWVAGLRLSSGKRMMWPKAAVEAKLAAMWSALEPVG